MDRLKARKRMQESEEAEMGVGTLIVFIAMIIVAAVAATVLITTAFEMQQQAEHTGDISLLEVSSGFKVINVAGDRYNADDWADSIINTLEIKVGLLAGSPAINVSDVIIEITDGNSDVTLTWVDSGAVWGAAADVDNFESQPLRDMAPTNNSKLHALMTPGDIAVFHIDCNETSLDLTTQTWCQVKIIPKHGIPTLEEFTTPPVYTTRYVSF